jgi:hypothetical protein
VRVEQDDFAIGLAGFFFCGAMGALIAPANPKSAFLIVGALMLLTVAAIWAARDAANVPDAVWAEAGRSKRVWRNVLLFFAPLALGGLAAVAYFAAVRPQLDPEAVDGAPPPPPPDEAAV